MNWLMVQKRALPLSSLWIFAQGLVALAFPEIPSAQEFVGSASALFWLQVILLFATPFMAFRLVSGRPWIQNSVALALLIFFGAFLWPTYQADHSFVATSFLAFSALHLDISRSSPPERQHSEYVQGLLNFLVFSLTVSFVNWTAPPSALTYEQIARWAPNGQSPGHLLKMVQVLTLYYAYTATMDVRRLIRRFPSSR